MQMRPPLIVLAMALALAPVAGFAQPAAAPAAATHYETGSTKIGDILADPAAKAAVDKTLPGFLNNDQIQTATGMTLKQLQQYVPDAISDAKLATIDGDFAKLPAKK